MTIAAAHLPLCGLRGQAHRQGTCERRGRIISWPRERVGGAAKHQLSRKPAVRRCSDRVASLFESSAASVRRRRAACSSCSWEAGNIRPCLDGNRRQLDATSSSVGWPVHWRGRHLPVRCLLYAGPRATKSGHCLEKRNPARKTRFCELRTRQSRACFPVLQKCEVGEWSGAGIDGLLNAWVSWTAPRGQRRHPAQRGVIAKTSHCPDDRPPDRKCTRHTKLRHRYCEIVAADARGSPRRAERSTCDPPLRRRRRWVLHGFGCILGRMNEVPNEDILLSLHALTTLTRRVVGIL